MFINYVKDLYALRILMNFLCIIFFVFLYVLMFFGQIRLGADPGRGKNRSRGSPSSTNFFSDWKATATNRMHSNDLEACVMRYFYFWFHSEVKFLTRFRHLFGLTVVLPYLMQFL